ncbi:MAG TPA: condensation domain-containing protein, partial [Thermoanaerobaculia bacterium]
EHQTVAELARHAALVDAADTARSEQGPVSGAVPLTPIQRWFFEHDFADLHYFNQALPLEPGEPLDPGALGSALAAVLEHHDALRLRFHREVGPAEALGWRQENAAAEPVTPFHRIDLAGLPEPRRRETLDRATAALQTGFDLSRGPLTRLALFETGSGMPGLLLWTAHHLVVDGVSWRVLLEDLEDSYRQAVRGLRPVLPPKTAAFRDWALRLTGHAAPGAPARELDHWLGVARTPVPRLPVDFTGGAESTVGEEATVSFELTADETSDLLQTVPSVYHNRIDEALLSALARTLAGWTGSPRVRVDLEGHGREPIFAEDDELDTSRTVGWFTAIHPVILEAGTADPGAALVSAKERLRAVPGRGVGYGLLRHLGGGEAARLLAAAPAAEISFNYLGQLGQLDAASSGGRSLFRSSAAPAGPPRSPRGHRTHLLEIVGRVTGGRLQITLAYGSRVHRQETAERLSEAYAGALRELIRHCREREDQVFTPSDFPKALLDAGGLDRLSALLAESD